MILSKATEYAIRALVYIRFRMDEKVYLGFREIAKEIGAPEPFTGKVLQALVRNGLLFSSKGPKGGFYLDESKKPLLLIHVIEAMEGTKLFTRCGLGLLNCSSTNPCPLHHEYAQIRTRFENLMKKESIWSLADKIVEGHAVIKRLNLSP